MKQSYTDTITHPILHPHNSWEIKGLVQVLVRQLIDTTTANYYNNYYYYYYLWNVVKRVNPYFGIKLAKFPQVPKVKALEYH